MPRIAQRDCLDAQRLVESFLDGEALPATLDCAAWGAGCVPIRGCAFPPGARCSLGGAPLLPCGDGDACVDGLCVVDDAGGLGDPTPLSVPGSISLVQDAPDDVDCVRIDRVFEEMRVTLSEGAFLDNMGFALDHATGAFVAPTTLCLGGPGRRGLTVEANPVQGVFPGQCIDDDTLRDPSGAVVACAEGTACRRATDPATCVPAVGEPCADADRCEGLCLVVADVCVPYPPTPPLFNRCSRLDAPSDVVFYTDDAVRAFECADRCEDGVGCIDSAPTTTCSMWVTDPAGGLGRCASTEVPAWTVDDFPGRFAPAPLVAPGEHAMTSTSPADVDCVMVEVDETGLLFATTTSGLVTMAGRPAREAAVVRARDRVRLCVEGHEGTALVDVAVEPLP